MKNIKMKTQNELYPIFLKVHQLDMLIVGGGAVAHEKLHFLLKSSPNAKVKLVAKEICNELKHLVQKHHVDVCLKAYTEQDMEGAQLVIAATDDNELNLEIHKHAKSRSIPINVVDMPALCDFYLGGVITKGNVKVAISTNGKSPTLAKRMRQFFEGVLPDDIEHSAENLNVYRNSLKIDFQAKVKEMNSITKLLIEHNIRIK